MAVLRFYATGSFQQTTGDLVGVGLSQPTMSKIIKNVSSATASKRGDFITFPTGGDVHTFKTQFHAKFGFPGVIGTIDCLHIKIRGNSVVGPNNELFRSRKGWHDIRTKSGNHKHSSPMAWISQ